MGTKPHRLGTEKQLASGAKLRPGIGRKLEPNQLSNR